VKRIDWTRNLDHFQTLVKKGLDRSNQLLFASAESLQAWKMLTSNECLVAVPTIHAFEVNPMLNRDSLASNTREKLGIPMGGKVILAVAVFEPRKRIEDVITAFLMLNLENTYLILVGQSGYFPDYEAMLFKLAKKSTKIVFHPLVEDVNPFYASADLFVHSSEEEVFPLVLQEASSWGLPIICSNYSGVDELLGEEYPFVFPVGDTNSLVGMIDKVLSNLELTKSLSQEIQKELIRKLSIYKHSLQAAIEESSKSEIFLRVESY
jgi:glycosyltransferase involved in cell wall biosynthesis